MSPSGRKLVPLWYVSSQKRSRWNKFLLEPCFPTPLTSNVGSCFPPPKPAQLRTVPKLKDFGIKRARITVPSFHDLFNLGSDPAEWSGAVEMVESDVEDGEDGEISADARHVDDATDAGNANADSDADNDEDTFIAEETARDAVENSVDSSRDVVANARGNDDGHDLSGPSDFLSREINDGDDDDANRDFASV